MARKSAPDWPAIQRDHRTGLYSDRELARMHAVSHTTIARRRENQVKAGSNAWQQDLASAVRAGIDNELQRDAAHRDAPPVQHARGKRPQRTAEARARTREPTTPTQPPSPAQARPKAKNRGKTAAPAPQPGRPALPQAEAAPAPTDAEVVAAAVRRGADVVRGHRTAAEGLKAMFDRLARLAERSLELLEERAERDEPIVGDAIAGTAETLDTMARSLSRITQVERQAYALDGKTHAPVGLEEEKGVLTGDQRRSALAAVRARLQAPPAAAAQSAAVH